MRTGFQHQDTAGSFIIPKSCAVPQHGQKADVVAKKIKERRPVEPRPGH
jgi:hypothetical protein